MNVGLDLRMVETRTSRILHTVSYQKQIVGREIRAGFFEFVGGEPLDLGIGERSQEPVQRGVRMVVERGVIELVSRLYGISPSDCLPEEGRPLWAEAGYLADAASPVQPTRPETAGAGRAKER
jgi:curli production assembly/transport component CsgG/holdfast attachment protein HfaB